MIVIDASAVLELLLLTSKAAKLEDIALNAREQWHAPHLIDVEVAQALRRLMLAKELSLRRQIGAHARPPRSHHVGLAQGVAASGSESAASQKKA